QPLFNSLVESLHHGPIPAPDSVVFLHARLTVHEVFQVVPSHLRDRAVSVGLGEHPQDALSFHKGDLGLAFVLGQEPVDDFADSGHGRSHLNGWMMTSFYFKWTRRVSIVDHSPVVIRRPCPWISLQTLPHENVPIAADDGRG